MRTVKEILKKGISLCSPMVSSLLQKGPIVLNYHSVGKSEESYSISRSKFKNHVQIVYDSDRSVYTLSELVSRGFPQDGVVFTFDDGDETHFSRSIPILESMGFEGVFFLTTDWINEPEYISWDEVNRLGRKHEIGTHTHTHPDLSNISSERLEKEIIKPKFELEDQASCPVRHFAYPYGQTRHITPKVVETAREEYETISSTTGRIPGQIFQPSNENPILIERVRADDLSPEDLQNIFARKNQGVRFAKSKFLYKRNHTMLRKKFR